MRYFSFFLLLILFSGCETTKDDSSITDLGKVFVSSNTQERITVFDFSDIENITSVEYVTTTSDADGIYYDASRDIVYQADRENDRINAYERFSRNKPGSAILPSAISTSDFNNPRGMTSEGNIAVIAQDASEDNNQQNAFFVYDVSANSIAIRNSYRVGFPLWDIQLAGNTLFAVEDESDSIAVFNSFLDRQNGDLDPDFKIRIDGITRTHGLFYYPEDDLMIMTDIGDSDPDSLDGAIHIITDFNIKLSNALQELDKSISATDQIIIRGDMTGLRNPVDVIYRKEGNRIIVAERVTGNGSIFVFDVPVQTDNSNIFDINPLQSFTYDGVSAIYINQ